MPGALDLGFGGAGTGLARMSIRPDDGGGVFSIDLKGDGIVAAGHRAGDGNEKQRNLVDRPGQSADDLNGGGVAPLHIVDHQHRGRPRTDVIHLGQQPFNRGGAIAVGGIGSRSSICLRAA